MAYTFDLDVYDHLSEFVYKADYSRDNTLTDYDDEKSLDERVFDFILPKTFYFHYDFGEDWYFAITIMSNMEEVELYRSSYRELKSKGKFVEYPDDEEDVEWSFVHDSKENRK